MVMLRCPCIMIIIMVFEVIAYYKPEYTNNVGTVLFSSTDLKRTRWNANEIGLLKARKYFQGLLPPPVFLSSLNEKFVDMLFSYFKEAYASIKREADDPSMDRLMTIALSDSIGGYLKMWVLPITKFAFYGGTISEQNVSRLFEFYDEIKNYLSTDGEGWRKPVTNIFDVAIKPSELMVVLSVQKPGEDPCDQFVFFEKTPEGLTVPMPRVSWDGASSKLFLPLKNHSIHSMSSMNSTSVLLRYYDIAKHCLQKRYPTMVSGFETKFQSWLAEEVLPHLEDENVYLALGSVLTAFDGSRQVSEMSMTSDDAKPWHQWTAAFNISRKLMILILLILIEMIWCCLVLFYTCYRKRKKSRASNVYHFVETPKRTGADKCFNTQDQYIDKPMGIKDIYRKICKETDRRTEPCLRTESGEKQSVQTDPYNRLSESGSKQIDPCGKQLDPYCKQTESCFRQTSRCSERNTSCCRKFEPSDRINDLSGKQPDSCSKQTRQDHCYIQTDSCCRMTDICDKGTVPYREQAGTCYKKIDPCGSQNNRSRRHTEPRFKKRPSNKQITNTCVKQSKLRNSQIDTYRTETSQSQFDSCVKKVESCSENTIEAQIKPCVGQIEPSGVLTDLYRKKANSHSKQTVDSCVKKIDSCYVQIDPSGTNIPCVQQTDACGRNTGPCEVQTDLCLLLPKGQCLPITQCQQTSTHMTNYVATKSVAILTQTNSNVCPQINQHPERNSTQSDTSEHPYSVGAVMSCRSDTVVDLVKTSPEKMKKHKHGKHAEKINAYTKIIANANKAFEAKEVPSNQSKVQQSRKDVVTSDKLNASQSQTRLLGINKDIQIVKSKVSINLSQIRLDNISESVDPIEVLKSEHLFNPTGTQIMPLSNKTRKSASELNLGNTVLQEQCLQVEEMESHCVEVASKASANFIAASKSHAKSVSFYNESTTENVKNKGCDSTVIDMPDVLPEVPTINIQVRTDKPKQNFKNIKEKKSMTLTNSQEISRRSLGLVEYVKVDEVITRNCNLTDQASLEQSIPKCDPVKRTDTQILTKKIIKDVKLKSFIKQDLPNFPAVKKNKADSEVKTTRLNIQTECKGRDKMKDVKSSKEPYWEITIDEPQKDVLVGIKGTLKMDPKSLKQSKIPKLSVRTIVGPPTNSNTRKYKSLIPQLKNKAADDLQVKSNQEKDDKFNTTI